MNIQEWVNLFYEKIDQWIRGDIDDKNFAVSIYKFLRCLEKDMPINMDDLDIHKKDKP